MTVSRIEITPGGPELSRFVMGAWRLADWDLDAAGVRAWIDACLEVGITTFDQADVYGRGACEEIFGKALAEDAGLRGRIELISKCDIRPRGNGVEVKHYDTSHDHLIASVEGSLRRLGVDHLDLLLLHRPDPLMDPHEIARTFDELHRSGKVRNFGVSNFTASQFDMLSSIVRQPLATNQVEISVMKLNAFQDGTLDQCLKLDRAPMAWSPLGGGRLFYDNSAQAIRLRGALGTVGDQLGAPADQTAFAWLLRHPARILPILGTQRADRIRAAVGAERMRLSREQWFEIWAASVGTDVP